MSIFNLDEGKEGGALVEGVDYILVAATNKNETQKLKVANFNNPKYCPREGIVEIEAIYQSKRHDNFLRFSTVYDRENDIYYGIPDGYDERTGNLKWKPIILHDAEVFDLRKRTDALTWAVLKNHYSVKDSPFAKGKPKYKVYDKEADARAFLMNDVKRQAAVEIARGLYGEHLLEMCRAMGKDVESMSNVIMQVEAIKYAEKNPNEFMAIWDSPTRNELFVFKRALSFGIIKFDVGVGAYMYGGINIGQSEPRAVDWLKSNGPTCSTIDVITKEKMTESQKSMLQTKATASKPESKSEKEIELERQIAALKAQLEKGGKPEGVVEEDPEMEALKVEAELLGIKGIHLFKKKDVLAQKIAEEKIKQGLKEEPVSQ